MSGWAALSAGVLDGCVRSTALAEWGYAAQRCRGGQRGRVLWEGAGAELAG